MKTVWQALIWKEWRENRWKLVAVLCTLLLSVAALWSSSNNSEIASIQIALLLPIIPISVVIATTVAAHERSQGTMPFLAALPISQRRVAVAKLVGGLATCLIPVFVVLTLVFAWWMCWDALGIDLRASMTHATKEWRGPFNFLNWFAATGSTITLWVISLFLWSVAAGVRRADEVSAGAMALALIGGVWIAFLAIAFGFGGERPQEFFDNHLTLVALANAIAPGGFPHLRPLDFAQGWTAWCVVGLYFAVQVGMAVWFVMRFGGNSSPRIRSHQAKLFDRKRMEWLDSPRRSPYSAILWKQFRESGPLALMGLGGVAMIVVAGVIATARTQGDPEEMREVAAVSAFFGCIYLGALTTLVIGIGVFLRDLETGLNTFWRSRPIEPNAWYWVKFVTGLAVVALTFLLPILIAPRFVSDGPFLAQDGSSVVFRLQVTAAATIVSVYSIAVVTTCLARSAVIATVLSMAGLYLSAMSAVLVMYVSHWLSSPHRAAVPFEERTMQQLMIAGMLVAAVISTIVGWVAVRNDWGRKSS